MHRRIDLRAAVVVPRVRRCAHALPSLVLLVLGALPLAGCSIMRPQPDRSQFFVLSATEVGAPQPDASARPKGKMVIGLGPVQFADYLDRAQIVYRAEENRVTFQENERWAEPLDKSFLRALSEDLRAVLGTNDIVHFPNLAGISVDYQVPLGIFRFERTADGRVECAVRWGVRDPKTNALLFTHESYLEENIGQAPTQEVVAALSRLVGQLSREIAAAIMRLEEQRQPEQD